MITATTPLLQSVKLSTGVSLPYVEQGDPTGIPVLLLHGVTDSWRSFERLLPHLPASIHAIAVTQRGHGDADRPAAGYRPGDFAADVAALLGALGFETAVIVGHSMGTTVAQRFALDFPGRLRGLLFMGGIYSWRGNPVLVELTDFVSTLTDPIDPGFVREFQESTFAQPVPPDFVDTVVAESLKIPARVWKAVFGALLEDDFSAEASKIAAPTLLLWGDQDTVIPRGDQTSLLAAIAGARLEIYPGVGHTPHWEQPARTAADIVAFVEQVAG